MQEDKFDHLIKVDFSGQWIDLSLEGHMAIDKLIQVKSNINMINEQDQH